MPDLTLIILSAGNSNRFECRTKKQWIRISDDPLWKFVAKKFTNRYNFEDIIITATDNEINYMKNFCDYNLVLGGKTRQESLSNALKNVNSKHVLVTDVARACIPGQMIDDIINSFDKADIIVPYLPVNDTVVYKDKTIDRNEIKLIQTPQLSTTTILKKALINNEIFTDDSSAVQSIGGSIFYVKGRIEAKKITTYDDLKMLECLESPKKSTFVGTGFDVHKFCKNKVMYLGGVKIDSDFGFEAHSDGDVALHALTDSLLGAIGGGDIGELFPDNDERNKDIDSKIILKEVVRFIHMVGFDIVNVDITIMAQTPRLLPYKDKIRKVIASILKIDPIFVNVKATTTEKLGFIGRSEGVATQAVSLVKYYNWKKI